MGSVLSLCQLLHRHLLAVRLCLCLHLQLGPAQTLVVDHQLQQNLEMNHYLCILCPVSYGVAGSSKRVGLQVALQIINVHTWQTIHALIFLCMVAALSHLLCEASSCLSLLNCLMISPAECV